MNKVARITEIFWCMKIAATTLGETLGDFIAQTLNWGYTAGLCITFVFFLLVLLCQLRLKTYTPVVFWLVIIGTTTLGTEISDFIDRTLQWGYTTGTIVLVSLLLLTLYGWFSTYRSLDVYPLIERKKELFY